MISIEKQDRVHPIRYTFKGGKYSGETFKARYNVCENSICTCCNIDLIFDKKYKKCCMLEEN
jgi:hypothetical protein